MIRGVTTKTELIKYNGKSINMEVVEIFEKIKIPKYNIMLNEPRRKKQSSIQV